MRLVGIVIAVLCGVAIDVYADAIIGGPKGGRLLDVAGIKAEFLVEKGHHVSVTFYDDALVKLPVGPRKVTVIAEAPGSKKTLPLSEKEGALFSAEPLPDNHGYTVVVQIKSDDASKSKNFRIPLDLSPCGECGRAEYACTCEGH